MRTSKAHCTAVATSAAVLAGILGSGMDRAQGQVIVSFDNLDTPPALDGYSRLQDASATGTLYAGVTWDTRARVAGADYKVDTFTPGPDYGIPRSGDFYLTNDGGGAEFGDSFLLTTTMVLTGGYFGQNEFYGFGGGADQITIRAFNGLLELGSVTFDLPENNDGLPEPLSFVDTSSFLLLSGITGYEIDRRPRGNPEDGATTWVADDLTFVVVPEPGEMAVGVGLGLVGWGLWRRRSGRLEAGHPTRVSGAGHGHA